MNLFEISNEFRALINAIEDSDGEITPEIEEALSITEENGKQKIDDYVKAIRAVESDIDACKLEKKRIAEVQERKEKLLNKLKSIVTEYVTEFGNSTKTGGKYIDCPTYKVSVRNSDSCEIDEDMIAKCAVHINQVIERLAYNNMFGRGLNFKELAYNDLKEATGFDLTDKELKSMKFSLTFDGVVSTLFDPENEDLLAALTNRLGGKLEFDATKSECKNAIKEGTFIPFAKLVNNKSLNIK